MSVAWDVRRLELRSSHGTRAPAVYAHTSIMCAPARTQDTGHSSQYTDVFARVVGTGTHSFRAGHDGNDYQVGLRHNLPVITMLDELGNVDVPCSAYNGMPRFNARDAIITDLEVCLSPTRLAMFGYGARACACVHVCTDRAPAAVAASTYLCDLLLV